MKRKEPAQLDMASLGVVVIGRNEGERLRRCLQSILGLSERVVYVDSGSTDGSVALAHSTGADVVELDPSLPFTAARARNAGFQRLIEVVPETMYVQFVDGDCELAPGWLEAAIGELESHVEVAVVAGRLRERHPDVSVYNRLCDIEWDGPIGEVEACGGTCLIRADVFHQETGYDPTVIAAEDDELCVRLRLSGHKIVRLDANMAIHDADITRFAQWWRRAVRAGHAFAQVSRMPGRSALRHFVRQRRSVCFWVASCLYSL